MSVRFQIAAMVYMMVQAVLFGAGMIAILATPLAAHAIQLIPPMIAATALISAPISWKIAPRLRARYWRARHA